MEKQKILYLAIIILFVTFIVWGSLTTDEDSHTLTHTNGKYRSTALHIATTPTLDCLPIFLAYDDSLFAALDLDVQLMEMGSEIDCDTALCGGSAQVAASNIIRAQRLIRKRVPLEFFSTTNRHYRFVTSGGTRIKKLSDLNGKLVGISRFSTSNFLAELSIDSVKLDRTKVYCVQINDFGIRTRMLINNELEGALLPEPQATEALNRNNILSADFSDKIYRLGAIVVRIDKKKERSRQRQLLLFKKAYNMAIDSININGMKHYRQHIMRHCHVKSSTIDSLHPQKFSYITPVRTEDINLAQNWLNKH